MNTAVALETDSNEGDPRIGSAVTVDQVVAVGYPARGTEMAKLSDLLGPNWSVADIHAAPRDVTVVLVHRCSPQTVHRLHVQFPGARVVLVEPADGPEGPDVCRCLSAGATAHVLVRDELDIAAAVLGSREFAYPPLAA